MNVLKKHLDELFLVVFVIITRFFYRSNVLIAWDSVNFALATEQFNFTDHTPHPPGYVLYVYLGKWLNTLVGDLNLSFIFLGIAATIGIALLSYYLGIHFFKRKSVAFLLSFLFVTNPMIWFYGEVALTYIFDGFFALLFFYLAVTFLHTKKPTFLFLFSFFLGLSGGIRPSLVALFALLWLTTVAVAIRKKQLSFSTSLIAIGLGAAGIALWFFPVSSLVGGVDTYIEACQWQLSAAGAKTSIFEGNSLTTLLPQIKHLILFVLVGLNSVLVLGLFGLPFIRKRSGLFWDGLLVVAWISPSLFVFGFVHLGQAGYILTILPALILVSFALFQFFVKRFPRLGFAILALMTMGQCATWSFFSSIHSTPVWDLFRETSWTASHWVYYFTSDHINTLEQTYQGIFNAVAGYDPEKTVVLNVMGYRCPSPEGSTLCGENYLRYVQYYLPEYDTFAMYWKKHEYFLVRNKLIKYRSLDPIIPLPARTDHLLVISEQMNPNAINMDLVERVGPAVFHIDVSDIETVDFAGYEIAK